MGAWDDLKKSVTRMRDRNAPGWNPAKGGFDEPPPPPPQAARPDVVIREERRIEIDDNR